MSLWRKKNILPAFALVAGLGAIVTHAPYIGYKLGTCSEPVISKKNLDSNSPLQDHWCGTVGMTISIFTPVITVVKTGATIALEEIKKDNEKLPNPSVAPQNSRQ